MQPEIALLRVAEVTWNQRKRIAELAAAVAPTASRYPERAATLLCQALRSAMAHADPELTRQAYPKFGIRSRTELADLLAGDESA